jgi:hypothetical protein
MGCGRRGSAISPACPRRVDLRGDPGHRPAEKFGFFRALMRFQAILTPRRRLTPAIVLIGANASVASDAG